MLNFYANPISPFCTRVHLFLEESGRPFKAHVVDLRAGEQKKPDFLKMNALGVVPTIELDGFGLGESNAILRYLAQKWQMADWYPVNLEDRARVDQMTEFTSLHVGRWLNELAWNLHFGPKYFGGQVNLAKAEDQRGMLMKNLIKLEAHMQGRNYLACSGPTIADVSFAPFAINHKLAQVSFSDFPCVAEWTARMAARPAWNKVAAELERQLQK